MHFIYLFIIHSTRLNFALVASNFNSRTLIKCNQLYNFFYFSKIHKLSNTIYLNEIIFDTNMK